VGGKVGVANFLKFVGGLWALRWAWQSFLDQSIGIDETNIISVKNFYLA